MSYDSIVNSIPTMTYEEQLNLMSVLVDAIKGRTLRKEASVNKKTDFTDTYPEGYFDLFGNDPTYPIAPDDIPVELDKMDVF